MCKKGGSCFDAAPLSYTRRSRSRRYNPPMRLRTSIITISILLALPAPTAAATRHPTSCYGPGLYGNRMANGQILTPRTIGIAHRSHRLGTRLLIRHRGRRIVVRVTDRGPYIHGRSFDITHGVARRLGYRSCAMFGVRGLRITRWRKTRARSEHP